MTTRLEAIEAREQAATKGPWVWVWSSDYEYAYAVLATSLDDPLEQGNFVLDDGSGQGGDPRVIEPDGADGQFIAHARTDIPLLLRAMRGVVRAIEQGGVCPECRVDRAHLEGCAIGELLGPHDPWQGVTHRLVDKE